MSLEFDYPQGDPGAIYCRECRGGRTRVNGILVCRPCDHLPLIVNRKPDAASPEAV